MKQEIKNFRAQEKIFKHKLWCIGSRAMIRKKNSEDAAAEKSKKVFEIFYYRLKGLYIDYYGNLNAELEYFFAVENIEIDLCNKWEKNNPELTDNGRFEWLFENCD